MATAVKIVENSAVARSVRYRTRAYISAALIVLADCAAVSAAIVLSEVLATFATKEPIQGDWSRWAILPLFISIYALWGLYPGLIFSAVHELRSLSIATSLVCVLVFIAKLAFKAGGAAGTVAPAIVWPLCLIGVPLARAAVRHSFSRRGWWGCDAIAFASGESGRELLNSFVSQPHTGLKIRAVLDNVARPVNGTPQDSVNTWEHAARLASEMDISHAIVSACGMSSDDLKILLEQHTSLFTHVLIIPELHGLASIGIQARDLCRTLTLEVRNNLLLPGPRVIKRLVDVATCLAAGVVAVPLIFLVAFMIRLESDGPAFYGQSRVGQRGSKFTLWKFRTMVTNADAVLHEYLARRPDLRKEWERDHKLRHDPRVTRIGKFLRKTSLDELPQLVNILRGEMSLVGPRPIVETEINRYGSSFGLYTQVRPGLTGLWQVSGRNDTTYSERVALDTYYVRNWSPWLDTYIMARTAAAVLTGAGAY